MVEYSSIKNIVYSKIKILHFYYERNEVDRYKLQRIMVDIQIDINW